jgi:hypothetical protein
MASIREQLMAAITTALNTDRPANVPAFVRTRIDSPDEDQLPINSIYQGQESTDTLHGAKEGTRRRGPLLRRYLEFNTESVARAASGDEPDKALDPSLVWIVKVMGEFPCGRGELANEKPDEMGTKFDYERAKSSCCRATMGWRVEFQTKFDDAEVIA